MWMALQGSTFTISFFQRELPITAVLGGIEPAHPWNLKLSCGQVPQVLSTKCLVENPKCLEAKSDINHTQVLRSKHLLAC